MIKKILKGLLTIWIIWLWIINFSNAQAPWFANYTWQILRWWENTFNWITTSFLENWNFLYNNDVNNKVLYDVYPTSYPMRSAVFWHDWKLYWIANSSVNPTDSISQWYLPLCLNNWLWDKDFCNSDFSFDYYNDSRYFNPDALQSFSLNNPKYFCFVYFDLWQKLCFRLSAFEWYPTSWDLFDGWVYSFYDNRVLSLAQSSSWGWNWWNEWDWWNSWITIDWSIVSSTCNKYKALNWYEKNWYTSKLCYWWLDDYTIWDWNPVWTLPFYWSWKDVLDIWAETANLYQSWITWSTMDYVDWFGYWRGMYNTYKLWWYSVNPFIWTPLILYTYYGAVNSYWDSFNSESIIDYCDLKLYTSDYSVIYTWVNNNKVCSLLDLVSDIVNWSNSWTWSSSNSNLDWSWNLIVWLSPLDIIFWSGDDENFSGDSEWIVDWITFIDKFYSSLEENFWNIANNSYWNWILPIYISIALMGIVLFRFISH